MFRSNTLARWASCLLLAGILATAPGCGGEKAQATAPIISTQPTPQTLTEGGAATFTVEATGNGTLSYQWMKSGSALTGKTATPLTLNPVTLPDAGSYTVVVTNSLNGTAASTTSNIAVLTVNPKATKPTISTQPVSQNRTEGSSATFAVAASGNGTLSYQWMKDGSALAGKTSSDLSITPISLTDAGSYSVVVTNSFNGTTASTTSDAAMLIVNQQAGAPRIGTQPQSQTLTEGGSVTFTVAASGNGTLSYQWMKDGSPLAGRTSIALTLNPIALTDAGNYTVMVTNSLNGTTASTTSSAAALTVNPKASAPTIDAHPVSQTRTVGRSVTFSVSATGNGTLSYQWLKNGSPLPQKTARVMALDAVTVTDAGSYSVVVTNSVNHITASTTSSKAVLTVVPPAPTIISQPQSKTVTVPDGATFSVTASSDRLTYEWRKNGTKIDGATGTSFTVAATDLRETSAQYSVLVTNAGGSATSENATLTVVAPSPTYAGDPAPVPVRSLEVKPSYTSNTAAPNGVFRFGFDSDLRNPVWTAYANFRFLAPFTIGSGREYQADDRLTRPVQVGDFYFATTGMSRGHQVMRSDLGYRYGQQATDDSNRMSNMAPQVEAHNGQIWADLEQAVGGVNSTPWTPGLADRFGRIWIYTGPIFSETPSRIPTSDVAIPAAFYKIIVREKSAGVPQAMAMLIPHQPVPPRGDLWKYVTSIARVESLAKLNIFPNLPDTTPVNFKTDVDVRGWGAPFEATSKPSVHMIEPSWDTTVSLGTTVTFAGAASSATSTVSNPTWTFGTEGSASGWTTSHAFNTPGSVSVSFSVTDGSSVPNTITRVITVTGGNTAPTISTIGNQTTAQDTAKSLTFTVSDDSTAAGSIVVTAASNNQTLLPDANVQVVNSNGTCTLTMTPVTGLTGTARLTITATDGNASTSTQSFDLTVNASGGSGQPILIISQYYENNSPNRWIEITNIGTGNYDSTGATKYYLGLWSNPFGATGGSHQTLRLIPSLASGSSVLIVNSASATPASSAITGTPVVSSSQTGFNGDDISYLSTSSTAGLATSWAARTDVLGSNASTWTGTTTTSANTSASAGYRTSWVRNATVTNANATFTAGEWTKVTTAVVGAAPTGDTNRLGEHAYNH